MRSIWVGLVAMAVLLTNMNAPECQARSSKAVAKPVKAPVERPPDREEDIVKGYGVNAATARDRALELAQARVRQQLAEKLGASWHPNDRVLDPEFLTRFEVVRSLGEPEELVIEGDKRLVASYHVRITRDYLQEVARVVRQEQMSDRHVIAVRVLIGLVTLLLVSTGYLRLEELTRGYATTMLRATALVVVVVVGMGLSWPWWAGGY